MIDVAGAEFYYGCGCSTYFLGNCSCQHQLKMETVLHSSSLLLAVGQVFGRRVSEHRLTSHSTGFWVFRLHPRTDNQTRSDQEKDEN